METQESAKLLCAGSIPAPASNIMFKKTAYIITTFILFLSLVNPVDSQEFTFEKAYQDYTFTREIYYQSLSDYQKAKEFYLKNQTLSLKEEARKKTLTFLKDRDELERVYLTALRIKIIETKGIPKEEKDTMLGKIESEVSWYRIHKDSYKDSDILEDLFNKSKDVEARYNDITLPFIYESLNTISLGEIVGSKNDHEATYLLIRKELDGKVAEGKLRIDPFNRWLTDIDEVITSLKTNESLSKTEIAKIYSENRTDPLNSFKASVNILSNSIELLNQLNNFLQELLTSYNSQLQAQENNQ